MKNCENCLNYKSGEMEKMRLNRKVFFDQYRSNLDADHKLSQKEVDALADFLDLVDENYQKLTLKQWAYVFATVFHETAHTFLPVKEAYWLSEEWRKNNLRYYPYYGRGFVQLTWDYNYEKYSKIMHFDLLKHPKLALEFENAFFILIHGCKNGTYTGRKLDDYINGNQTDYYNARRVINGTDKAQTIASYALEFEKILNNSL